MTHSMKLKRLREAAGFVHVAGWVPVAKAPAIRREIEKAKEEVEAIRDES